MISVEKKCRQIDCSFYDADAPFCDYCVYNELSVFYKEHGAECFI